MKKLFILMLLSCSTAFAGGDVERAQMGTLSGGVWTVPEAVTASVTGVVRTVSTSADLLAYANGGVAGKTRCANGDTIRMSGDITATAPINLAAGVTLDLGGYTLSGQFSTELQGLKGITIIRNGVVDSSGLGAVLVYGQNTFADGDFKLECVEFKSDHATGALNLVTFSAHYYPVNAVMDKVIVHGATADCISTKAHTEALGKASMLKIYNSESYDSGSVSDTNNCLTSHFGFQIIAENSYFHSPAYTGLYPKVVSGDIGDYNTPIVLRGCKISGGEVLASHIENSTIDVGNNSPFAIRYYSTDAIVKGNTIRAAAGSTVYQIAIDAVNQAVGGLIENNTIIGFNAAYAGAAAINVDTTTTSGTVRIIGNKIFTAYRGVDVRYATVPVIFANNTFADVSQYEIMSDVPVQITNGGNNVFGAGKFLGFTPALTDAIGAPFKLNGTDGYFSNTGNVGVGLTNPTGKFEVSAGVTTNVNAIKVSGNINNYLQFNIQNGNAGATASSDVVATANTGNETTNFIDMGINSSGFTQAVGAALDGYLYTSSSNLILGTTAAKDIKFFTNNANSLSGQKAVITSAGNVGIGITNPSTLLQVGAGNFGVTAAGTVVTKSLIADGASASVADDGTITLATGVAGTVTVWTEAEYGTYFVGTDGAVTLLSGSTNAVATDTDAKLCVYDGGTGAVIRNRLGSTKTVRYRYMYS